MRWSGRASLRKFEGQEGVIPVGVSGRLFQVEEEQVGRLFA